MDGGLFWACAIAAAMLVGMGKGGMPVVGMLGVPILSLAISPVTAAGLLLPVYVLSDLFGLYAYRHAFDRRVLAIMGVGVTIGVGIGGQLACEEFKKDEVTGFRGTIYVDSTVHGQMAVRLMHAYLTEGTEIPARTIIDGILITKADTRGVAECQ